MQGVDVRRAACGGIRHGSGGWDPRRSYRWAGRARGRARRAFFYFLFSIYRGGRRPTASDNAQINGDLLVEAVAFARLRKYKMSASEKNSVVVTAPSVDIICKGARTILLKIKASLKPE